MKKIKILLVTLFFAISLTSFAQSKVGHVKTQEIIALMPAAKAATAEIEGMAESYKKEIEEMEKDVNEKQNKYASEQNTVSDELNQMRGAELQDQISRIQAFSAEAQREMQRKQIELLEPISKEFEEAVSAVADRLGLEYVFEFPMQGMVVAKGMDLTEEVKKELGL